MSEDRTLYKRLKQLWLTPQVSDMAKLDSIRAFIITETYAQFTRYLSTESTPGVSYVHIDGMRSLLGADCPDEIHYIGDYWKRPGYEELACEINRLTHHEWLRCTAPRIAYHQVGLHHSGVISNRPMGMPDPVTPVLYSDREPLPPSHWSDWTPHLGGSVNVYPNLQVPQESPLVRIALAGNYKEYNTWIKLHNITPSAVKYINGLMALCDIEVPDEIYCIGTFTQHPYHPDIMNKLQKMIAGVPDCNPLMLATADCGVKPVWNSAIPTEPPTEPPTGRRPMGWPGPPQDSGTPDPWAPAASNSSDTSMTAKTVSAIGMAARAARKRREERQADEAALRQAVGSPDE